MIGVCCLKGFDAGNVKKRYKYRYPQGTAVCAGGLIPALVIFPVYFIPVPINRYAPFGTAISNRAPLPGIPFSVIVMPVIDTIPRNNSLFHQADIIY